MSFYGGLPLRFKISHNALIILGFVLQDAFSHFPEFGTLEVHLATNFQNILYDRLPTQLRDEIYAYLRENHAHERKPNETDEQFYYKTRKRALGAFKKEIWNMTADQLEKINKAWEKQFRDLFDSLGMAGTRKFVDETIKAVQVEFNQPISSYFIEKSYLEAFGNNVVNVILVDFRALDTMGEVIVLSIAAIGVSMLFTLKKRRI